MVVARLYEVLRIVTMSGGGPQEAGRTLARLAGEHPGAGPTTSPAYSYGLGIRVRGFGALADLTTILSNPDVWRKVRIVRRGNSDNSVISRLHCERWPAKGDCFLS